MSSPPGHALGVDFGTSHTVAVIRWPDGRARPLLIDGSPLLPSAVYADPVGGLSVGRDAVHSSRLDPARFEPNPKRRVDDGEVLLGDRELPVGELITAVLSRVAEEWRRTVGDVVPTVTLTCPATWGATRRTTLSEAAARAGFPGARLVAEPVAATTYFAEVLGRKVPLGSVVVVHDFGAGTFDASVVVRRASGFEVLAVDGRDDVGGVDIDAAVVTHLGTLYRSRDPQAWDRLVSPGTVEDRRAKRQLWDDVRVAKERLSRAQRADLMVPLLDIEVHLTRDELEELARPLLDQTVKVTEGLMRWARLAEGSVAGVFLVGGSSRIPLMATLLHRALGEAPVVIEQPELVVAEGAVLAEAALLASAPAAPGPTSLLARVSDADPPSLSGVSTPLPSAPQPSAVRSPSTLPPSTPPPSTARPAQTPAGAASPAAAGATSSTPAGVAVSPAGPSAPTSPAGIATGPTIGRVIMPGAKPPGPSRITGSAQVAPTRQQAHPNNRPAPASPLPPHERPASAARPAQASPPPAARAAVSPAAVRREPPAHPAGARPGSATSPAARRSGYRPPRRARRVLSALRALAITGVLVVVPVLAGWIAYRLARGGVTW